MAKKPELPYRALRIDAEGCQELVISKATAINLPLERSATAFELSRLQDGTYRIIYNAELFPDFSKVKGFKMIRKDACKCGERSVEECPGEWEQGCDLGANPNYASKLPDEEAARVDAAVGISRVDEFVKPQDLGDV